MLFTKKHQCKSTFCHMSQTKIRDPIFQSIWLLLGFIGTYSVHRRPVEVVPGAENVLRSSLNRKLFESLLWIEFLLIVCMDRKPFIGIPWIENFLGRTLFEGLLLTNDLQESFYGLIFFWRSSWSNQRLFEWTEGLLKPEDLVKVFLERIPFKGFYGTK